MKTLQNCPETPANKNTALAETRGNATVEKITDGDRNMSVHLIRI